MYPFQGKVFRLTKATRGDSPGLNYVSPAGKFDFRKPEYCEYKYRRTQGGNNLILQISLPYSYATLRNLFRLSRLGLGGSKFDIQFLSVPAIFDNEPTAKLI